LGKVLTIIFGIVTVILVPLSIFYIADTTTEPPNYTLDIQGRLYDVKFGDLGEKGFTFFKFSKTGKSIFSPQAWNEAFTDEVIAGIATGTFMMILWYISIGLGLVGIIVAFFKPRIAGIFFILAVLTDLGESLVWYFGMQLELDGLPRTHFPIPVGALFMLITAILAFTSKKKESYYYSPGYSYGYGRR
jgi:hypothetical protein